jgi:iron complex transport system substrate-binding protein
VRIFAIAGLLWLGMTLAGRGNPKPQQIVSINLVSDIVLLELVEHERIAALSHLSVQPSLSIIHNGAGGFVRTHGRAEEIIALRPDLVVGARWGQGPTLDLIQRLGIRTHEVPLATSYEEIRALVRSLARVVGEPARGEQMVQKMEARRMALQNRIPHHRPNALFVSNGGFYAGNSTLQDEILADAGMRSAISSRPDLEQVVMIDPEVMIEVVYQPHHPTIPGLILAHPALRGGSARKLRIPLAEILNATQESPRASATLQAGLDAQPLP